MSIPATIIPICITGMHRSGTSMVARLLHECGLNLGREDELLPATKDNPDGHWEHKALVEVNDSILGVLGGGWDCPPAATDGWEGEARFERLGCEAGAKCGALAANSPWGWKDPRNSLTLPFWQRVLGELKVIICLRNPLEVAASLRRRGFSSYLFGLGLWHSYNVSVLSALANKPFLVTHYEAFFARPEREVERIAQFAGLAPAEQAIAACLEHIHKSYRHSHFKAHDLVSANVSPALLELYNRMCEMAEWTDAPAAAPADGIARIIESSEPAAEGEALEATLLRQELAHLRPKVEVQNLSVAQLQRDIVARDRTIELLRGELESANRSAGKQVPFTTAQSAEIAELRQEVAGLRKDFSERYDEIHGLMYELSTELHTAQAETAAAAEYLRLAQRIRKAAHRLLPRNVRVAVISKGDEQLLSLYGRAASHFPAGKGGAYLGFHPFNSLAAIAQLESARRAGIDYLLIPATAFWWLKHYGEFGEHLARRCRCLNDGDENCLIFALRESPAGTANPWREFEQAVDDCERALARGVSILDWGTRLELGERYPSLNIFSPAGGRSRLPYLDGSIDIVAVGSSDHAILAEARRIASVGVAVFEQNGEEAMNPVGIRIEWRAGMKTSGQRSASIIVACPSNALIHESWLDDLRAMLPRQARVEVIVSCNNGNPAELPENGRPDGNVVVRRIECESDRIADLFNAGAAAANSEYLVFAHGDVLMLPGWLEGLWGTFRDHARAGAAAPRILFADGRLREAGRVMFADGSSEAIGEGQLNLDDPMFNYVRQVNGCGGGVLMTPRGCYEQSGGFDSAYQETAYVFSDYCVRLIHAGREVLYQPASAIVLADDAVHKEQCDDVRRFAGNWYHALTMPAGMAALRNDSGEASNSTLERGSHARP